MRRILSVFSLICLLQAGATWAQLSRPNQAGVAMGHLHYRVRDVAANRKFWIDMGAVPVMMGEREVLRFPDVIVLLTQGESSGGTEGSVVNHVGFRVPSVAQLTAKMKAAGYKVQEDATSAKTGKVGNVFSPEGERIELLEDLSENAEIILDRAQKGSKPQHRKMTVPITLHHIHYYVPQGGVPEIKAWYIKMFGALPATRLHYEAADLPGVNLNFSEAQTRQRVPGDPPGARMAPTKGRMLDHIGFEISHLEAFCKNLEANGVKLDQPYKVIPSAGIANAYLTDPWGTYIELTEGMNRL